MCGKEGDWVIDSIGRGERKRERREREKKESRNGAYGTGAAHSKREGESRRETEIEQPFQPRIGSP